jgi:hypothetical protein
MRDIAKEMRMSFSTIGDIIKRDKQQKSKEKELEGSEKRIDYDSDYDDDNNVYDNIGNGKAKQQQQQYHHSIPSSAPSSLLSSLSPAEIEELSDKRKAAIAYRLYDQGKSPVYVATQLYLLSSEARRLYREYWGLKRHYELYHIYPEIKPYLSTFVKLFKELKRRGLNPQNVKWYVDCLNIGTIKMEDIEADYENAKAENQNLLAENENIRNEIQSLQYENQDLIRQIEDNRRIFENRSKAILIKFSPSKY